MTTELKIREAMPLTPAEVVENATTQAKLLMDIVEKTHCYQTISGKKYLQVEAWQTIGAFNRVHAITEALYPIMREGEVVGYDAKVNLINLSGMVVGSAVMPCYFTENACKGKDGDAKDKASKSAAQTFAESKAYRMNYSYVAILAGYEPTPAEEMTGDAPDDKPAKLEHWCEIHKMKWFKSAKMSRYAHPYEENGEKKWCNEPTPQAQNATSSPVVTKEAIKTDKPTTKRDGKTVKTLSQLWEACYKDFQMNPPDVLKELGVESANDLTDTPTECYEKIAAKQNPKT